MGTSGELVITNQPPNDVTTADNNDGLISNMVNNDISTNDHIEGSNETAPNEGEPPLAEKPVIIPQDPSELPSPLDPILNVSEPILPEDIDEGSPEEDGAPTTENADTASGQITESVSESVYTSPTEAELAMEPTETTVLQQAYSIHKYMDQTTNCAECHVCHSADRPHLLISDPLKSDETGNRGQ